MSREFSYGIVFHSLRGSFSRSFLISFLFAARAVHLTTAFHGPPAVRWALSFLSTCLALIAFICEHLCLCLCAQSCLTLCNPMACSLPGFSVHGDFPGKNTGRGCHFLLQGNLPDPGIKLASLVSPALTC